MPHKLNSHLGGIWVPIVTPFRDGHVDYATVARLASHVLDSDVRGLVVAGTTGEGPALGRREKAHLVETLAQVTGGRVPLVMGLEGPSTHRLMEEVMHFRGLPIDGYLVPAPSYVRPNQEGIYRHFACLSDVCEPPIIIYDIPARTGVTIGIDTLVRLRTAGNFPAIKACGLTHERLSALLAIPELKVLCGDDVWLLEALEMGAHGAIMASAQILPKRFAEVFSLMQCGDTEAAWKRFHILHPFIQQLFADPNPSAIKAVLALQGWIESDLRLPLVTVNAGSRNALRQRLREMHALEHDYSHSGDKSGK